MLLCYTILYKGVFGVVNKEDVKNHLEHILERGNERKKMSNNLINNDDYINWLDDFTKVHPEIIILEIPNINYYCGISLDEFVNISFLSDFYKLISKYARKNYIFPNAFDDYGNYYVIKVYNVFYEIGVIIDDEQDVNFFCRRLQENEEGRYFIDFKDIKENKVRHEVLHIRKNLKKLVEVINQLILSDNIPVEAIADTTAEAIQKIMLKTRE